MKIIAIGDIHGRHSWAKIVAKEELSTDKIIFVGDYFDTFAKISPATQIENFEMILEYKRQFPDKVVMLLGNHDFHYIVDGEKYSGYQDEAAEAIGAVVKAAIDTGDLVVAHQEGAFLFTHAGVSQTWAMNCGIDMNNPVEEINLLLEHSKDSFRFSRADSSGYGESIWQSPIWIRPDSLIKDMPPGYTQVVGHSTQPKGIDLSRGDNLILIDTLGVDQYLIIEDAAMSVGKI